MTDKSEAHRAALAEAVKAYDGEQSGYPSDEASVEAAIAAYDRALAAKGWVRVRDVGAAAPPADHDGTYFTGMRAGWNMCRDEMLKTD